MISRTSAYAIQLLCYLAEKENREKKQYKGVLEPVFVYDVADKVGIPRNFLSKIAVVLAKKGILGSQKGPKGGVFLKVSPDKITLYDICEIFGENILKSDCILGNPQCGDSVACPMHNFWKKERERFLDYLRNTTIAKLISKKQ